jgi:two-component system sensor histidine kinase QseC
VLRSGDVWIQVAERDDARTELAARLAFVAVLPLAIGGPLLLLLLSLLIRYGVAPLKQLSRRLQTRRPDSLEPMVLQREPAEMGPLLEALNALLVRMQEALARERRFTAHAAHELRTPLAAMQVHAQNAAGTSDDAERRTSLDRMVAALRRTVHLSEQMMAYSRASAPASDPPAHEIALGQVVIEVMAEIEPRFHARRMPLTLSGGEECRDIRVRGDRHKIASVVSNLLDNALNYAPAGSAVDVKLSCTPTTVTLSVSDAGPGIPAELRERVFEGYFRVPGSTASGSGLGLAIVKEIVAQHGASIALGEGANGIGTRVDVRFPVVQAAGERDESHNGAHITTASVP